MKNKQIVWFPYFRYYTSEMFEKMLNEKSNQGWNPARINLLNFFLICFVKNNENYTYVIDVLFGRTDICTDVFRGLGWKLIGNMSNIYVWRIKSCNDLHKGVYDTQEEKRQRNKKYASLFVILFICSVLIFLVSFVIIMLINKNILDVGINKYICVCVLAVLSCYYYSKRIYINYLEGVGRR